VAGQVHQRRRQHAARAKRSGTGCSTAFLLDTLVRADRRRRGFGVALVREAVTGARAADWEWLHVDFQEHVRGFYLDECGFTPTGAGLIPLR
jgi:GNAT superfamily N-acetyltransferase